MSKGIVGVLNVAFWIGLVAFGYVACGRDFMDEAAKKSQVAEEQKKNTPVADPFYERKLVITEGTVRIKDAMRDPDSFVLESSMLIGSTEAGCLQYRSKNGFGGYAKGQAVISKDGKIVTSDMSNFVPVWQRECAGRPGVELVKR